MTPLTSAGRARAFLLFVLALVYYYLAAEWISPHAAAGLSSGVMAPLLERSILLFLLLVGYAAMGRLLTRQPHPLAAMGLDFRPGWRREFAIGAALGWGMLIVAILPLVLTGGLIVTFWTVPAQFGSLLVDLLMLAVAALAEEVAFRGYPFQRLIDAIGPTLATLLFSWMFAALHVFNPGFNRVSFWVTVLAGSLLSIAYLRTRALWVCWGWHFAWNASMCLIFGLPLSGLTRFSPVIQSNTIGPAWMTGGNYGPEASHWTALVLLLGLFVVYSVLRNYAWRYAQPQIVAAGIPVDLDAMSSTLAPHHQEPAPPRQNLVQILPLAPAPASAPPWGPVAGEPTEKPE